MKKLKMQPENRCRIWHSWVLKKDTGVYRYHECRKCGARIMQQYNDSAYQPTNDKWVLGLTDEL